MTEPHEIITMGTATDGRRVAEFLATEGQIHLPRIELIEQGVVPVDEFIDAIGTAAIEAVLMISAEHVAGPKQQGKDAPDREIYWYGSQPGRIALRERQLRVAKPRLRKKNPRPGEVAEVQIPAYEAMRKDSRLSDRMLSILIQGVSTRRYEKVLPRMAEQVGISKSQVSREGIAAGTRLLRELAEQDFRDKDILVIYIDGIHFGDHVVIGAIGVDAEGRKHLLGLREGATENTEVAKAFLEELVERGITVGRRRLFVIDGSKALRKAIDQVFGTGNPVQRCRNHKIRNVLRHLPRECHDQARATLRAAWKLDETEGIERLEHYALWLSVAWPEAAGSVLEGIEEMFTVNRLGLPGKLRRCLVSTNIIDSTHSGVRQRTRRVTNWKNGQMALRWAGAAFIETAKSWRRISGHALIGILKASLDEGRVADTDDVVAQVG